MIFRVSEKFKGSCALPTLKRAIWANMTVSITGNDLRADDIRDVIKKGILIPVNDDYDLEKMEKDHDVIIINNTSKVMVLGKIVLRANGSLPISKDLASAQEIISAAEDGFVTILSDEGDKPYIKKKKKTKKKVSKKKKKVKAKVKVVEDKKHTPSESGEDKDPTALTWNFKSKEMVEAEKVPKAEGFIEVEKEEEDGIDFVDAKLVKTKTKKKVKKTAKKSTRKKVSAKKTKKKVKKTKNKKVKTLRPVGEKKLPKTSMDAAVELDSRGNPIGEKAGDFLKHMIDEINAPDDVSFADDEQALKRYNNRTDMD